MPALRLEPKAAGTQDWPAGRAYGTHERWSPRVLAMLRAGGGHRKDWVWRMQERWSPRVLAMMFAGGGHRKDCLWRMHERWSPRVLAMMFAGGSHR